MTILNMDHSYVANMVICSAQHLQIMWTRRNNWIVFFGLCASTLLDAAEQWTKVTTPHFELYTTAGEKKAREAILYFEQVRSFFLQASPSKHVSQFPVRIVAFKSEKEF